MDRILVVSRIEPDRAAEGFGLHTVWQFHVLYPAAMFDLRVGKRALIGVDQTAGHTGIAEDLDPFLRGFFQEDRLQGFGQHRLVRGAQDGGLVLFTLQQICAVDDFADILEQLVIAGRDAEEPVTGLEGLVRRVAWWREPMRGEFLPKPKNSEVCSAEIPMDDPSIDASIWQPWPVFSTSRRALAMAKAP